MNVRTQSLANARFDSACSRFSDRRNVNLPHRQSGVVLMVALIVLVAMALAGIAMVRSMGTGLGIAGNLAFRQNAQSSGDRGTAAAITQVLNLGEAGLLVDNPALAYFATMQPAFDPLTYAWRTGTNSLQVTSDDGRGNEVRIVVHRLCVLPGIANGVIGQSCVYDVQGVAADNRVRPPSASDKVFQPAYRVTTAVFGPRNSLSYTQTIVF
jgi:type IV pilus assembly protein PilX